MKKLLIGLSLLALSASANADFFNSNSGEWKMGPYGPYWDESDWPEWTPMYWMEEFFNSDDDDYGAFGGMPPYMMGAYPVMMPYGMPMGMGAPMGGAPMMPPMGMGAPMGGAPMMPPMGMGAPMGGAPMMPPMGMGAPMMPAPGATPGPAAPAPTAPAK